MKYNVKITISHGHHSLIRYEYFVESYREKEYLLMTACKLLVPLSDYKTFFNVFLLMAISKLILIDYFKVYSNNSRPHPKKESKQLPYIAQHLFLSKTVIMGCLLNISVVY